jgi:ATP/maltotriose-dependent transcriptional regulator MalT
MAEAQVVALDPMKAEPGAARWQIVICNPDPARGESESSAGTTAPVLLIAEGEAHEHLAPALHSLLTDGSTTVRMPATEPSPLTGRERQVLGGFDRGLCDKQIARELEIAVSTVKSHARSIYQKLEAGSRTAALHAARQLGLL